MDRYRFYILTAALTLLLVLSPVVRVFNPQRQSETSQFLITALILSMLLSAVVAVARTRVTTTIAVAMVIPLIALHVLQTTLDYDPIHVAAHVLRIAFLAYAVLVIIGHLFATARVTSDTICAALCVYLLLGLVWADVYSLVGLAAPDSFRIAAEDTTLLVGGERTDDALYYSFVTLTTLGYGDVTPTSPITKMLSTLEAIVGQLFLAVLVARLVGLHIAHAAKEGARTGSRESK